MRFGSAMEDLLAKVDHMKRAWRAQLADYRRNPTELAACNYQVRTGVYSGM